MEETLSVDQLIDSLIDREGGYVNHPADKGGPTCFGVTEAVARAHGYAGPMRYLPRTEAAAIYRRIYWLRPRFDEVPRRSAKLAAELFDTGVNMGPAAAATFVQRALTALNRNGGDYPDLVPDGRIAERTLAALDAFFAVRGKAGGETVLLRALEALNRNGGDYPDLVPDGRIADKAAAERVRAEQTAINERSNHDLQIRLADARARAERLRQLAQGSAHPGGRGSAPVPGLPAPAGGADQAAGQDRLPVSEALTATEQAIQLDELIGWVRRQHSVDPNATPQPSR